MKKLAAGFLAENDKERIRKAVKEAEKTTSGEIIPMIVSRSYTYPLSNIRAGLILGLIIGIAYALIFKDESLWVFLVIFMITLMIIHKITEFIPPLKRLFISKKEIRHVFFLITPEHIRYSPVFPKDSAELGQWSKAPISP